MAVNLCVRSGPTEGINIKKTHAASICVIRSVEANTVFKLRAYRSEMGDFEDISKKMAASAPSQVHVTITELAQYGNINQIGQFKAPHDCKLSVNVK